MQTRGPVTRHIRPGAVPVVALVGSAGSQEAFVRILAGLPRSFGAAVVVLRHHSPGITDRLAWWLASRIPLPVTTADDDDPLLAGRVLVAPSGHHTMIVGGTRIALIVSGDRPPYRPSADMLLSTMAVTLGRNAVAVVLSGYGMDGATGATAVHRLGGTVLASDEATSPVFAMPQAAIARDAAVDHVLPVDAIPGRLHTIVDRLTADRQPT